MSAHPVLIGEQWQSSSSTNTFQAVDPSLGEPIDESYPLSEWSEIEQAIVCAADVAKQVRHLPGTRFADFLEAYATRIETLADDLVAAAHRETALPTSPRLADVELPRTTNQLRQAADAAREGSWTSATIDTQTGIRSMYGPTGPVVVFGPNNFPFAFNSIAGGDFAAAVAAGNPVIAKGHSSHPTTTRLFAEAAEQAVDDSELPRGFVQLIYRTNHDDGARLVSHPQIGATAYTGSRDSGLTLKRAADEAGRPIYLELSSINPVFVLPGTLDERLDEIVDEFAGSCLMGTGQFCTNPGLVVLQKSEQSESFISKVREKFDSGPVGTLLGPGVLQNLERQVSALVAAGAEIIAGGQSGGGKGCSHQNTLLRVDATTFLNRKDELQAEAFGNEALFVIADDPEQMIRVAEALEGNLTGTIYSDTTGRDDDLYDRLAPVLRHRVGRLSNDKMPTGVAVSSAMNHGGPYPATGHPAFTAVGIPASLHRFAQLQCYDNVRPHRLPPGLRDENPNGAMWRLIDGTWSQKSME